VWKRPAGLAAPCSATPGWFGGTVFGDHRRDRPLQPLFGVEGFGVVRTEPQPDGSFKVFNRELAFYKDLKTGEFLDVWKNPYTKEEVEVMPIHNMTVCAPDRKREGRHGDRNGFRRKPDGDPIAARLGFVRRQIVFDLRSAHDVSE
jgi:hypothetical protein